MIERPTLRPIDRKEGETVERFYTLDETADLLHMHTRTVRNRIRDGKLKATKPGRRILIAESDLLAYMESTAAV